MDQRVCHLRLLKGGYVSAALLLGALVCTASASASDSLRVTSTRFPANVLLVTRYHISNPSYCLAKKPSYSAPNFDLWVRPRCVPYTVQRAHLILTVLHNGQRVNSDSLTLDGAYGDPSQGGTWVSYIYCGLLADVASNRRPNGTYYWTLTLIDPFHRSRYNTSRSGAFTCHLRPQTS